MTMIAKNLNLNLGLKPIVMRLGAIMLLLATLQVSAYCNSQVITLNKKNITLKKVFDIVQKQSGYSFIYDADIIDKKEKLDINVRNKSVEDVLKLCLKNTAYNYTVNNKIVVIKPGDNSEVVMATSISGKVVAEDNTILDGATIFIKELGKSTLTDANGNFTFTGIANGTYNVVVSYIGYQTLTQSVTVSGEPVSLTLVLKRSTLAQDAVVVTALGISKQAKTLTYSTQTVSDKELTTVKNTNVLNSLNGKVAGVQINRTSGGAGGSVRVVLRGDKSTRSSQPLYVIDGMPLVNPSGGPNTDLYSEAPDQGDVLSTINPEDIESINILKGASASALYGSQGSNGVIIITTKKGKSGFSKIDFSSSIMFDKVSVLPNLQYTYGQTTAPSGASAGSEDSWGKKGSYDASNGVSSFFKTGTTWINSISLSAGTEKSSSYFSYSNTNNKGVVPTSSLGQNTLTYRNTSKFFDNKLIFDGTFLGSIQNSKNRLTPSVYFNPLTGLYLMPRGLDFNSYRDFEYFSPSRYLNAQNWWNINLDKGYTGSDYQQNPYWVINRNAINNKNQNAYSAISLKYLLSSWLTLQARGNITNFITEYQRNIHATTQGTLSAPNGRMIINKTNSTTLYGDLLLLGNKNLSDKISVNFTLGTSIQDQKQRGTNIGGSPVTPNVFLESAIDWTVSTNRGLTNNSRYRQIQSVFGNVEFGFDNKIFLSLSDRNDWSSTLAYTPSKTKGYNYPAFGANAILSELVQMPSFINFAKIRGSYAIVGNDVDPYATYPVYTFNAGFAVAPGSRPIQIPGYYLQPEKNKSLEIGTEWRFLHNRLSLDLTYYKSNITNQYFNNITVATSLGVGSTADVNGGDIQNSGVELSLSYKAINTQDVKWTTTLNMSSNKNKVIALYSPKITSNPNTPLPPFGLRGGSSYLTQGGSFGDIYGKVFNRDSKGNIIVDANGAPSAGANQLSFLGNPNPRFILGWNNSITIKTVTLGFLIDGKFGGKVMSLTEPYFDKLGVSQRSADARDNGGVVIPGAVLANGTAFTNKIDPKVYYQAIGGTSPINEAYMYDATAVRLREVSLLYAPNLGGRVIKDVRVGLIGNNLFFFSKKAPFDPEQVAGVNPGGVGVDVFGFPAFRSFGLSLKCSF